MNGLIQGGNDTDRGESPIFVDAAYAEFGDGQRTPEIQVPTAEQLVQRTHWVGQRLASPTGERKSLLARLAEGFLDGMDFWSQN